MVLYEGKGREKFFAAGDSSAHRVGSTAIRKVRYHPVSRRLEVVFLDSDVYQYVRFPRVKFHALLQAESKGRFVNEEIRPKHRCAKISD
jgi:hypothetical protein